MARASSLPKETRLAKRREAYRSMPREKYLAMRAKENAAARQRREAETPGQREARLAPMRERARRRLASETAEQRQERIAYQRKYRPHYRSANIDRIKASERMYYEKNRARLIENGKAYRKANPEKASLRSKNKRAKDPCYAIAGRLRCRLRNSLVRVGAIRAARTFELVGCSQKDLVLWLERQFLPGMSWENRSLWHVDHIVPLSAFDLTCEDQQRVAFHYTNLRPLWAKENIVKRDRIPVPQRRIFWDLRDIAEARGRLDASRTITA